MRPQTKEEISLLQLCLLIILFEMGTAIVIRIGTTAKQDAWIAVLISTIFGILLMMMYHEFIRKNPNCNFYDLLQNCYGRFVSILIVHVYTVYFTYCASRVLRDFNDLLVMVVLPNTPIEFTSFLFMMVVAYIMYFGIEVFSRTAEIFSPYIFLFIIAIVFFLWINHNIDPSNLKPVLYKGWKPIVKAIYPGLLSFPFGELIVFTIIMNQVREIKKAKKYVMASVALVGIIITIVLLLNISVLGVSTYARTAFPLLTSAREISIANFIERLDALVVFIVMLGVFVKVSIYFYCVLKGLEFVYSLPFRYFSFPAAMLIASFSVFIAFSFSEHLKEGLKVTPLYFHIPFQIVIPFLLYLTLLVKNRKGGKQSREKSSKA